MVKERHDSALSTSRNKFSYQISAARRMRRVIIIKSAGVKQRKSVMVAGRERDILASRRLRRIHQIFCPRFSYLEAFRQIFVFGGRDFPCGKIPLPFFQNAVQPEMHKHSEAQFFKTFYIFKHFYPTPFYIGIKSCAVCHLFFSKIQETISLPFTVPRTRVSPILKENSEDFSFGL